MSDHLFHVVSTAIGAFRSWGSLRDVRRVLIYKLDHLGDVLLATPGLRAVRRRFPNAEIRLVVGEWSVPVLENNRSIDALVIYNSPMFARHPYTPHSYGELREALEGWRPDLVIGLRDDWHTLLFDPLFRPIRRITRGRVHLQEWLRKRRGETPPLHETARVWEILRPLGVEPEALDRLEYNITADERKFVAEIMAAKGIGDRFAIVHAGTSVPLKEWPIDRFAELARQIAREHGLQIVLNGSREERERSQELASKLRDLDPIDLSGQLGIRHSAALMERASLYVGSDGGAMHIAAAVGTPTVGLFGPGNFDIFHPVGPKAIALSRHFSCSPCSMLTCSRPHDPCMLAITPEEVMAETDRLIEQTFERATGGDAGPVLRSS